MEEPDKDANEKEDVALMQEDVSVSLGKSSSYKNFKEYNKVIFFFFVFFLSSFLGLSFFFPFFLFILFLIANGTCKFISV